MLHLDIGKKSEPYDLFVFAINADQTRDNHPIPSSDANGSDINSLVKAIFEAYDNVNREYKQNGYSVLMTDGNICFKKDKNRRITGHVISLALQEDDLMHLKAFQRFLDLSHRLYHRVNYKTIVPSRSYGLSFSSIRMASTLVSYGFVPKKSKVARVQLLEDNRNFWRGAIDGDGTISIDSLGRPWMKFVGSFEIVLQFKKFL